MLIDSEEDKKIHRPFVPKDVSLLFMCESECVHACEESSLHNVDVCTTCLMGWFISYRLQRSWCVTIAIKWWLPRESATIWSRKMKQRTWKRLMLALNQHANTAFIDDLCTFTHLVFTFYLRRVRFGQDVSFNLSSYFWPTPVLFHSFWLPRVVKLVCVCFYVSRPSRVA